MILVGWRARLAWGDVGDRVMECVARAIALLVLLAFPLRAAASSVPLRADPRESDFSIYLYKGGVFGALAEDHWLQAVRYSIEVEWDEEAPEQARLRISVPTEAVLVIDPKKTDLQRRDLQDRLESSRMLDVNRYEQIVFESTKIEPKPGHQYRVSGNLTIRDQTRPLAFDVVLERQGENWRARGEATFRQSDFGIQPFTSFKGSVRTKDDARVVFNIVLKPSSHR